MWNKPLLGGFDIKYAGAYLLPPTTIESVEAEDEKKKKKKKRVDAAKIEVEKMAAVLGDAIVIDRLSLIKQQLRSGDLGGGWHPDNQINPIK